MNNLSDPFSNHTLRQAVAAAIDTDDIIKSVYYGYAERLQNIVIPRGGVGFDPRVPGFVYDKKAAQLAQQAGVNGLDTQIAYDTTNPEHTAIATIVQAALAPIGINATPTPLPPRRSRRSSSSAELPMAVYAGLGYVDDPNYNPEAFWDSKSFTDFSGYKNPKVDATLKALHQEARPAEAPGARLEAPVARAGGRPGRPARAAERRLRGSSQHRALRPDATRADLLRVRAAGLRTCGRRSST